MSMFFNSKRLIFFKLGTFYNILSVYLMFFTFMFSCVILFVLDTNYSNFANLYLSDCAFYRVLLSTLVSYRWLSDLSIHYRLVS